MRTLLATILVFFAAAIPALSFGYCSEPNTPSFYASKPSPPIEPYCLTAYSNTCSSWEVDSYNDSVDRYNSQLRNYRNEVEGYARELQSYIDDAVDYAKCALNNL